MKRKKSHKSVFERNYEFEFQRLNKIHNEIERLENEARVPNITNKAASIEREEPVGDRLYKLAMSSISKKHKMMVCRTNLTKICRTTSSQNITLTVSSPQIPH